MKKSFLTPPPTSLPFIEFETQVEASLHALPTDLPATAAELLIALDIDGTLLTEHGVTEVVRSRMRKLSEAGAQIMIATGRGYNAVLPFLEELRIPTGWVVASNGALLLRVLPEGVEVVDVELFAAAPVIDLVLERHPDALIAIEGENSGTLVFKPFPEGEVIGEWHTAEIDILRNALVSKIIVRKPHVERDEFDAQMSLLDLSEYQIAIGWTAWMDVIKKGVSKAWRLEEMRKKLRISAHSTIAVGDGTNDIEMLKWAHFGVAMGDARDEVKQAAQAITGPVEYDGAGAVLEALIRHYKL